MQVDERFRIDEHAHVAELKNAVALPRLRVEPNVIAQPGTSAALHAEAQSALLRRDALLHDCSSDLGQSFVRDLNAFRWSLRRFRFGFYFDRHRTKSNGRDARSPFGKTTALRPLPASPLLAFSSSRGWPRE